MTALAIRVLSVAVPSRGGQDMETTQPGPDASASSADAGPFRLLLALPRIYVAAALGLHSDPAWASRPYVPDPAANRAHDVEVARQLLARHGRARLLALFPQHAAVLGIVPTRSATVTVTVVETARPALPAAASVVPAELVAAELVEVARKVAAVHAVMQEA